MIMYDLFELVRLLSVRRQSTRQGPVEITRFAWRENGEFSLLALLCSNDQLLLRWSMFGRVPVVRQLPWAPEKRVVAMCFDPTVSWLLMVTEAQCLYILPALSLLNQSANVNQLWTLTDCTIISVSERSHFCAACWWNTLSGKQVAIVATKVGTLLFVDLLTQKVLNKVTTDIQVNDMTLIQDDDQMNTYLLMTGVSSGQWKMLLEARTSVTLFSSPSDTSDMGYIDIDTRTVPPQSVLDSAEENLMIFTAEKIPQSQSWMHFQTQYARGRHFISAHDHKAATLQVYDSEIHFSPLFIYRLPIGVDNVILTDRLMFTFSRRKGSQMIVLSNQRAETSAETLQDFNDDAVIQKLDLPVTERVLGACHHTFPFYWHDKLEEQQRVKQGQSTVQEQSSGVRVGSELQAAEIPVSIHTVLDGCIIVTDCAVYECRPRVSPERLFLRLTMAGGDMSLAEHLAISVGLDITMLAQLAAHYLLKGGQVSTAVRLFALSKCSHSKRCASLARYGHIQEMVLLLKHALYNTGLELTSGERRVLADMLLHCYVHMVAHQLTPCSSAQPWVAFREFLMGTFSFDEATALELLAEFSLTNLLLDFAMARGLVTEALERLVAKGQLPITLTFLTQLVTRGFSAHVLQASQGAVLSCLSSQSLVQVLITSPELITRYASLVKCHLTELDLHVLLQLAAVFDPSQATGRRLVRQQAMSMQRCSSLTSVASFSSVTSTSSEHAEEVQDGVSLLSRIVEVFVLTVLHINSLRGHQEPLTAESLLCDPNHRSEPEAERSEEKKEDSKRRLALQFCPASCSSQHAAVVREGDLYTWGRAAGGRLGHGELIKEGSMSPPMCVQTFHMLQIRVEAVTCGGEHTLAITQHGVYGWGNSRYGQVGVGTRHTYHRPMLVETLLYHQCVALDCGQYHSLALTDDGRLWSWGWGVHGQLGHGTPSDELLPRRVQALSALTIVRCTAGYCHSLVLSEQGQVWSFGCGYFGQLGIGQAHKRTYPVLISAIPDPVTVISTKYFHSVAVTQDNQVYSWGCHPHNLRYAASVMRRSRQMGQSPSAGDAMEMFQLPALVDTTYLRSRVVQAVCGSLHTCLLTQDGEVYVWGRNLEGQLGTGSRQDERVPKMLTRINDQHVVHLCTGGEFNLALDADLSVWVWGKNDQGQLGLLKPDSRNQSWKSSSSSPPKRGSSLVQVDVMIPTSHRALPPASLSSVSRWLSGPLQSLRAAAQDVQWVSEEACGTDDILLPNLQSVCSSELPYHSKVIPIVVKYLGDWMDRSKIQQHCVDHRDWVSAAHLCMQDDRHIQDTVTEKEDCERLKNCGQALCYRLMALGQPNSDLPQDVCVQLTLQLVRHHLELVLKHSGGRTQDDLQLRTFCYQVISHWVDHGYPMSKLQVLLEPYLDYLAAYLSTLLFRFKYSTKYATHIRSSMAQPVEQYFCQYFKPSFCLGVLHKFLLGLPSSEKRLQSWLPEAAWRGSNKKKLVIQPEANLIPYSRLWQDIVRNVSKPSLSTTCITVTQSQLDYLLSACQDSHTEKNGSSTDVASSAVVLFTCGHHYPQSAFGTLVQRDCLEVLLALPDKLPSTAGLLEHYYRRPDFLPIACHKCVLKALTV